MPAPQAATDARPKRRAAKKAAKAARKVGKSPRLADPYVAMAAEIAPKKAKRAKKTATPRASSVGKLDINAIVSATVGLKQDEALSIVGKLGDLNKTGKVKVVGALGRLFA